MSASDTVNQLLFGATVFPDLPEMNWFASTIFFTTKPYPHLFFKFQLPGYMAKTGLMRAILDNEVLGNLAKLAHKSQYSVRY